MNKRGLSPLVATVLLIAFAVSLGAVVMNMGVSIVKDPCGKAKVEVLLASDVHKICFDSKLKTINVALSNSGEVPVDGVKLTMTGNTVETYESALLMQAKDKQVLLVPTELTTVDVFSVMPFIRSGVKLKYCSEAIIDYSPIPKC